MTPRTVWLASYPKSGNTWVRALLTALLREGGELDINRLGHGPIASARGHLERYTGLIASDLTPAEIGALRPPVERLFDAGLERTRYRKIHDALFSGSDGAPIVAPDATLGAVYVVRDPRDVAVSFAHHSHRSVEQTVETMGNPEHAFEKGVKRIGPQVRQRLDTWSNHVLGWLDHDLFPVTLVRYEDLHADPARELRRIADAGRLEVDDAAVEAAVDAARFERLAAQEERQGFRERPGAERRFFRRGVVEAWRDELPAELAERIECEHGEVMARLGYPLESPRSARLRSQR